MPATDSPRSGPEPHDMTEDPAGPTPIARARSTSGRQPTALEAVVALARDAEGPEVAGVRIADVLAEELGAVRVRVLLLRRDCDQDIPACLDLLAASGAHVVLGRDLPSLPLDGSTDLARVAQSDEAEFHGDVHGLGERPEGGHTGLGRWRSGVTTQSSAVLPLAVRGRVLGVLSLEWPTPRAFEATERRELESIASAAALVLASVLAEEDSTLPHAAAPGCTPGPTAQLAVTSEGMVVPAGIPGGWAASPALLLHIGAAAPGAQTGTEEVFWDVAGIRSGLVMITLGMANAAKGGAGEVAETARHMLRASALQGAGPARGLGLLAGWLTAAGPGSSWVSALTCEIDVRRASMTWCAAGSVALVTRYGDGRFDVAAAGQPPLGSSATPDLVQRDGLVLPGDRVVLACGDVAALDTGEGRAAAGGALSGPREDVARSALGTILDVLKTPTCAEGAIVVEVGP
jgi:hypothetical protein